MEKLGWKVPLIGSWTLSMANFIDNAGKNGNGTRMPQTFIQDPNTPKRKAFIDAYVKAYNPPRPHAVRCIGCAGLRLDLPAGRRHQAGRHHRRPEGQGRAGKPEREGRRRGHHLQQAVQQRRPRSHHGRHHRVRRSQRRQSRAGK
jgi:hypothetical protein